jgi:G patch domain-containing protein 1
MPPEFDAGEANFKSQTEEAVSKTTMDKLQHELLTNGPALQRPAWMGHTQEASGPAAAVSQNEHAIVDVEKNDALSNERASEDVFRAIFGDDSDDEN